MAFVVSAEITFPMLDDALEDDEDYASENASVTQHQQAPPSPEGPEGGAGDSPDKDGFDYSIYYADLDPSVHEIHQSMTQ